MVHCIVSSSQYDVPATWNLSEKMVPARVNSTSTTNYPMQYSLHFMAVLSSKTQGFYWNVCFFYALSRPCTEQNLETVQFIISQKDLHKPNDGYPIVHKDRFFEFNRCSQWFTKGAIYATVRPLQINEVVVKFFLKVHPPICAVAHAVMLSKKHRRSSTLQEDGLTNEGRHVSAIASW